MLIQEWRSRTQSYIAAAANDKLAHRNAFYANLRHWKQEPAFAPLRPPFTGEKSGGEMDTQEQQLWRTLWDDIDKALAAGEVDPLPEPAR